VSRAVAAASQPPAGAGASHQPRILIVEDESSLRDMLRIVLRRDGYEVLTADSGRAALALLQRDRIDLLVSDIRLSDITGMEVLKAAKAADREIVAFIMTAFASADTAIEALRLGAADYFQKPFSMEELRLKIRQHLESTRLRHENVLLKRALNTRHEFSSIIGRSDAMLAVFRMIEAVAQTGSTVLVTGESGTGKELVARAIHFNSPRRDRPFVALNCGAVPETLLESELFGHMKGAFTGADTNKKGLLETADRGTVFLDEIGEMNVTMQVKLLRVLQERRYRRLGGTEESTADIRVVAATNQNLVRLVSEGKFREDLYYRINVIPMHLPPLRERREDIALLAAHFLEKHAVRAGKALRGMSEEALELLTAYAWPGNVRELENVIERCVALEQASMVLAESLPPDIRNGPSLCAPSEESLLHAPRVFAPGALPDLGEGFNLEAQGEDFYRHYIALALERSGGVQVKAAELLGMSFRSFRYYAKKLKLR
jgi:two-component system response regulator PilR (NtrC family)